MCVFGHLSNHIITSVLVSQFTVVYDQFRRSVDRGGRIIGDIRTFKQRRQAVCNDLKAVDGFLKFGHVVGICCELFALILALYWSTVIGNAISWSLACMFVVCVLLNVFGLLANTLHGVTVNHAVSTHTEN